VADPDDKDILRQTRFLNNPAQQENAAGEMEHREPQPGTATLTTAWRLRFKMGEQSRLMSISEKIIIGRTIDNEAGVDFDLTPYGAYHFGVSRHHAIMTLHDGFLYLEDNGSTNGTRINGFQLTPKQKYRLRDGDEVEFARLRTTIKFERPA
jgi:hypothetical protein